MDRSFAILSKWGCLLVLLIQMVFAVSCSSGSNAQTGGFPPPLVEVGKATSDLVREESEYIARFESRKSVTLSPRVGGIIRSINTASGSMVGGGQVLIRIEASQQEAAVRSASAGIESRSRIVDQARSQLASLEADKISRDSNLKLAKIQLDRVRTLQNQGVLSRQELDIAENNYQTAISSLGAINAQIQSQKATIAQAQTDTRQASAALSEQQAQLRYYDISAPFAGVVGDIPVKVGDYVSPSTQLMTITVNQPLEAYIYIPVEKSSKLRTGMPVELIAPDGRELGPSRVFFVAPGAEGDDQTILIKAEYANSDGRVRVGESGQARIVWSQDSGLWIPATAVTQLAGQNFLFLAKQENGQWSAHQTPVKLGQPTNSKYPVIDGITPEDEIVLTGTQNLFDKMPITIKGRNEQPQQGVQ
ncbi:MAG TPA: efflux RND transporter periplasmic adaptor subunit [Pyrinomonadaceae bacterium]|nr:efflux RND transporter periplasmic adaptor subunit [Pyrinomonadaceae bacterium]